MLSDYDKGLFTPDCLVGVETNRGYIDDVRRVYLTPFHTKPITFVHINDSSYFIDAIKLNYYISDESDETVSFSEYINMFYDGWCNENEIKP